MWAMKLQQAIDRLVEIITQNLTQNNNQNQNKKEIQQKSPLPQPYQDCLHIVHEFLKLKLSRYDDTNPFIDSH